jgi:hypothetical protein
VRIGDSGQRVLRLDGKREYFPPKEGSWLETLLKDHPEWFCVETTASPHVHTSA